MYIKEIISILIAYLIGAIPFSIIVCYLFKGVDVRKFGSGNAGATNVYRVAGITAAILASLLDIMKGALPVYLVLHYYPDNILLALLVGIAAVIGHVFPIYVGFKGGKGVNTLLGVFLILLPFETLICLIIFFIVFAITRIISISSMAAGVSLSLIVLTENYIMGKNISLLLISACLVVSLLVLFTHRSNIKRLISGEEKKLSR